MYQNVVKDILRHPDDKPTIGLLLVKGKNQTVVAYSLAVYRKNRKRIGMNIEGHPQFLQMLKDIESGKDKVEFVLVFKLSRFGRNAADVLSS